MATLKPEIQKEKKDGTRNIKIILTHKRKLKRIPTDIYVTKEDLTRSGKLKNQAVIDKLNDKIRFLRDKCSGIDTEWMSIDEVYSEITKKEVSSLDFIDIFNDYIDKNRASKGIKNYKSALNSMIRFLGRERMDIKEVNIDFLLKYSSSLGGRAKSLYLGSIRHVYEYAVLKYNDEEKGVFPLSYSLFKKFKVPRQNVAEKRSISLETLRRIINLPYDETVRGKNKQNRFNLAKDVFMIYFGLIGTNAPDLFDCDKLNKDTIIYQRTKTRDRRADKAEIHVTIHNEIKDLVKKYRDYTGKRVFRFYQMYSTYKDFSKAVNIGLKDVVKRINHDIREENKKKEEKDKMKEISDIQLYAARHTWATIARNEVGIDKNTINDALNHVDPTMRVTDLYIKKDFSAINEANGKVLKYVFGE